MVTKYGKKVRKMRIDKGVRLKDMSDFLNVSSSFLSAIENGKKTVPEEIVKKTYIYFRDEEKNLTIDEWREIAKM